VSTSTRVGTEVAGYRLERVLGHGGMSVVYLAEHVRLGRKVALKLLAPALSEDESYRERFVRESRRAAELEHPNIIPIYDAGEDDGQLYIAMRYIEGSDLKGIIKRDAPMPLGRVLFILEQIAGALEAAHERDLVHRDVKPSNILVSEPSDRVYLTDFGVVKHTASRGLTKTGFFIGTVDYAPPEQIEGLPLDARTDIYALGCVFYECLTGRPPFDREGEVAVMHAHLTEPPPRLTAARPDLPKTLNDVLATAMAKAKEARYDTCDDFIAAARDAALQRATATRWELPDPQLVHAEPEAPATPPPVIEPPDPAPTSDQPVVSGEAPQPEPPAVAVSIAPPGTVPVTTVVPPPPPEPAAAPLAAEPPSPGPDRPSRSSRRHWLVTALLVAAAAAASGIAVYFVTKSDSTTSGGGGTPAASTGSTQPQQAAAGLPGLIPAVLFRNSCVMQSAPLYAGAVQSAVCTPPVNAADRKLPFYPARWEISIFSSATALKAAYDSLRSQNGIGTNFGSCNNTDWQGEGPWRHTTGTKGPGGHRFCTFEGNIALIVWTHEKLGQPNHIDMLAAARSDDHTALFNWWRFWHHQALGKCATEGCVAQLPR
jgi:serine/threonine protein kinase